MAQILANTVEASRLRQGLQTMGRYLVGLTGGLASGKSTGSCGTTARSISPQEFRELWRR